MIGKTDLVEAKLKQYFYSIKELDELKLELVALETKMGAKSPKFDSSPSGYSVPRDEKLLAYSRKKTELDEKILAKTNESNVYYNVLHLYELDEQDIMFLSLLYKEKLSGDEIASRMCYTNRMYVSRKQKSLLEKLSKYF